MAVYPLRQARAEFLNRLDGLVPQVAQTLREKVFPHYPALLETRKRFGFSSKATWEDVQRDARNLGRAGLNLPEFVEFVEKFRQWARDWTIPEPWLLDHALKMLRQWHTLKDDFEQEALKDLKNAWELLPLRPLPLYRSAPPEVTIEKRVYKINEHAHFDWLAQYKFLRLTPRQIAKSAGKGVDVRAVRRAVRLTANRLEIEVRGLRPRGRPRSTSPK